MARGGPGTIISNTNLLPCCMLTAPVTTKVPEVYMLAEALIMVTLDMPAGVLAPEILADTGLRKR